jgi:hypothetical protein
MGKRDRRFIQLDWTEPNCLRAQDIPYNDTLSIKGKIDSLGEGAYMKIYRGTGDPSGVLTGNFGDEFYDTDQQRFYKCLSFPSGTYWERLLTVG